MVSQTLIDVAIDQFGRLGFEGASTREIARASGTAMSSITYHFGGKQGLYLAAAEHIGKSVLAQQQHVAAAARERGMASPAAAIGAVADMLDSLAQMMLRPETESWARFVIREQQEPTEAFDRLYASTMQPLLGTLVALIRHARPELEEADGYAAAVLLFGQAMVLRAGRAAISRIFGCDPIDEATSARLRARLRMHVHAILTETP